MTKFKTYFKLARKNMKSMGNIRIPYVVATGLAFSILYIFIALSIMLISEKGRSFWCAS